MFVDASALVAILLPEPIGDTLFDTLLAHSTRMTSAIAIWEATARLEREHTADVVRQQLWGFLEEAEIDVVPITPAEARIASIARVRYSSGRYKLNMGDCFAYACAKANGVPLLFTGIDFTRTDVNDGYTL